MSIDHVITLFKIYTTTNFSCNIEILSLVTYMSNLFSMNAIIILLFYAQRTCGYAASSSFIVGTQLLHSNFMSNSWFFVTTSTSCLITACFLSISIGKKFFLTINNIFHVYLMSGLQKNAKKKISDTAF